METTTTTPVKTQVEIAFSIFNAKQIEIIKEILRKQFWGDCDQEFNDKKTYYAHGYFTNLKKGKEFSGLMSGISKTIKSSGTNSIIMCSDWWGDGSGDMMFFNMDLLNETELENWAKN